jgi:hypothetical protein
MLASHYERRKKRRQGRRRSAWISYGEKPDLMLCVLWDLSEGGARIAPTNSKILPDLFTLYLSKDRSSRHFCRVAWRNERHIGVQFIDESVAENLSYTLVARQDRSFHSPYGPFRRTLDRP